MDEFGQPYGQADIRRMAGHVAPSSVAAPTSMMQTPNNMSKQFAYSGVRTNPIANQGNYGGSLLAAGQSNIFGQFFVGPYTIGSALRTQSLSKLSMETYIGAFCNILVTGWVINSITSRPSVLDSFGLVTSAGSQVGFGMLFTPTATVAAKVPSNEPPPQAQY